MPNRFSTLLQLLSGVALGTVMTVAPLSFDFDDRDGLSGLSVQTAFAKGGDDDDDSDDDSDSSGSGSGGGSDDDDSDDDDDDSSGHSADDDDDDDDSGRGRGRGRGGDDDDRYEDDDRDEARHGRGRGGRDEDDDSKPRNLMDFLGFDRDRGSIAKVEAEGDALEVEYGDGWKEEIENGRYELKNPGNETVVERPATQADIDRLSSAF